MNISRYSGILLAATGILHLFTALVLYRGIYLQILSEGILNTIGNSYANAAGIWNLTVGILLILWGITLQHYQNETKKPIPVFIGYTLLIFSIILCIVMPISGAWLFIPQAIIILLGNRNKVRR